MKLPKSVKFRGITARWMRSVLLMSAAIIVLIVIIVCTLINSIIDNSVKNAAASYALPFKNLVTTSEEEFESSAMQLAESFDNRKKAEVQVVSESGRPIVSTAGYINNYEIENAKDYNVARANDRSQVTLKFKNTEGESVMATTYLVKNADGKTVGAYRWVVSLSSVNRYRNVLIIGTVLVGIAVLVLTAFSGMYFVKSIVNPLALITNAARKIAAGEFDERLDADRDDEIGELCSTINYMAGELSNAENMKNDFISSVSHELRTPLTAIKGWGETVKVSIGQDDSIVKTGTDIILSEAERLSGLVEELLDFSRMQSDRLTLEMKDTEIGKIIEEVFLMYAELASKQKIELTYIKPKHDILVLADKNRIKQVFINIVDNAIKYSNEGGHVIISTEEQENCIKIMISDTGVGIPAGDLEHVKEKFYKANKVVHGSGIGLAVADEIVKQHNGLLFVESTEGVGTGVTVVLPTVEKQPEVTSVFYPPQSEGEEAEPVADIEEITESAQQENDDKNE